MEMSPWQEIREEHRGVVQTASQCPLVCVHSASPASPTMLCFFWIMGLCGPIGLVMQKGVTCVCHKWALV